MSERAGVGRREGDGHCSNHEKNTTDIAKLKGYVAVIALLGMPIIGYYVGSIDKKMEKSADKQETIITMVHENKSLTIATAQQVNQLELAVREMSEKKR